MSGPAVVFDLDGTLADSAPGIVASYRHTLDAFGRHASDEAIRACIGPPLAVGLARLGIPAERGVEAVAIYRRYFGSTGIYDQSPYPGIPELLGHLHERGATLALATSKRQDFAQRILEMFDVAALFTVVAGATEDGARTDKVDIVAFALAQLGIGGSAAVVVGDRRDDMEAAAAVGARSIAVTWGYGSRAELEAAGAGAFAADPPQLLRLLAAPAATTDAPAG
jgi:phosphoglycolate phosphatase